MDDTSRMEQEQLRKLPYLTHIPTDGRRIPLTSYWDPANADWIFHLEVRKGELGRLKGGEPVRAEYFAPSGADNTRDLELALSTLIMRNLSFPQLIRPLQSIENDVHLFADILEKFELISERAKVDPHATHLAESEVEFLIRVVRSVYDLFQKVIRSLGGLLVLHGTDRKIMQQLPESFAKVVLKIEQPRSKEHLIERFRMPHWLADFYVAEAPFFIQMRGIRNGIEHKGRDIHMVFALPQGLAVRVDDEPWKDLPIWDMPLAPNRLGPLRAVFLFLVLHVIGALDRFSRILDSPTFVLPAPLGDFRVFLRNPYGHHLVGLADRQRAPWDQSPPTTP